VQSEEHAPWNPHYVCKKCQEEKYPIINPMALFGFEKCADCGAKAEYLVPYPIPEKGD